MNSTSPLLQQIDTIQQTFNEQKNDNMKFDSKDAESARTEKRFTDLKVLVFESDELKLVLKKLNECDEDSHLVHSTGDIVTKPMRSDYFVKQGGIKVHQYCDKRMFKDFSSYKTIVSVSHKWLSREHPDPNGAHYEEICSYLRANRMIDPEIGIFFDYMCLPQRYKEDDRVIERSREEEVVFRTCLSEMSYVYACSDIVLITNEGYEQHNISAWCQFESVVAKLRGSEIMIDPKPTPNQNFKMGMSTMVLKREIDDLLKKTKASNGSDLEMIRVKMFEFISKDLGTTDVIRARKEDMIPLKKELPHRSLWRINCDSVDFLEDGFRPLDEEDKNKIMEIHKSRVICESNCLFINTLRCLSICPMMCCYMCCMNNLTRVLIDMRMDISGATYFISKLQEEKFDVLANVQKVMITAQYTHLVTYNVHAGNIEETMKEKIKEVYGGFDNFVRNYDSGWVHYEIAKHLVIMNAIDWKTTDKILHKQIMI